ncbi:hypothetical protein JOQ06_020933 [Pogonophryne albipinna]|uniref:Uncharacterized protein n=1 Tax=Pogonophryne albipinna TaxID=1090488 RepID=A0AAD6BRA9_9TELE|nr:hypothetical protein JOQ06_020933 [Pogonophryne albipinna]
MKQQLSNIKAELTNVNTKIAEAETQIEKMEDRVQNVEQVLAKMMKVLTQQEIKLLDQEGRSRRENIRIYNVPEGEEGTSMVDFVEKLLRDTHVLPPRFRSPHREGAPVARPKAPRGTRRQTTEDGTQLYQTVDEATIDMNKRGLPVRVTKSKESLAEQLARYAWKVVGGSEPQGAEDAREQGIREKLRIFRREPSPPSEEM